MFKINLYMNIYFYVYILFKTSNLKLKFFLKYSASLISEKLSLFFNKSSIFYSALYYYCCLTK